MLERQELPEWAQRLHEALTLSRVPVERLYAELGLPHGGGWLGDALAGRAPASRSRLALLSALSGIPLAVLVGDTPIQRSLAVALRAGLSATQEDIGAAADRAETFLRDLELLLSWYPQEAARASALAKDARRAVASDNYYVRAAQRTAERLRDYLALDDDQPIGDIVELIEALGVAVIFDSMPGAVQGITLRDPSENAWRAVIVVNTNDTWWGRQRFTLAHELCHFLYQDDKSFFVNRKHYEEQDLVEIRAEAFARHFLAPDVAVREFWSEHGPKRAVDGYGVPLAKFMMRFGLSRQASIKTLTEAAGVPETALEPYKRIRISDIMRQARLSQEWLDACANQGDSSASHWALSMALDAYRDGLVSSEVVARILGRGDDAAGVERELAAQGYEQSATLVRPRQQP
ncbi:ImmA/IrrE family metallo-endopeptidase [Micromonospora aurantiaca]|uniref:ImmA/IrrE family metallo-endopeptidase n=1 Tax=Micromonospora aurantiaca (nom. illeg.) TaxID=47850 RepID=A0ABQ6UIM8_9ACTN|nr:MULTISPECIES: ImmA/IrrE family metallo-endopeptidase [Micromonospora]KAB1116743.1 ImmA/IrrE family metallo-endopeptidase [Micromonospora aurantiaca]